MIHYIFSDSFSRELSNSDDDIVGVYLFPSGVFSCAMLAPFLSEKFLPLSANKEVEDPHGSRGPIVGPWVIHFVLDRWATMDDMTKKAKEVRQSGENK
jgi:hypothetical protein